jgi:integrative and conjugative element protein (TIGR02256 family)
MAPAETGGVLLGYWVEEGGEPVVTHAIGPGPEAVHERTRFIPDDEYQYAEIARLYRESGRRLSYLGDWHTHPGGAAYLSRNDRATLRRIASYAAARAPRPVMLILAPGPNWEPSAWNGILSNRLLWRQRLDARPLRVQLFGESRVV